MTLVIWAFTDGKPGHENQTRGLVSALGKQIPVEVHWIMVGSAVRTLWQALRGGFPPAGLPAAQLLIGAGHATHVPMLLARRARGGHVVVLMKPSLPLSWFDLCVAPQHDGVSAANVFNTRGALNAVTPEGNKDAASGLILLGGASRHYGWSDSAIVAQVAAIVQTDTAVRWTLTTSRRTPPRTLELLHAIAARNLTIVQWEQTDSNWLPTRLASAARIWVSEDSVSMVYEALTSGAATGLLQVPRQHVSRISRGMAALADDRLITRFADWQKGAPLAVPANPFNEAARAATWIRTKWFPDL